MKNNCNKLKCPLVHPSENCNILECPWRTQNKSRHFLIKEELGENGKLLFQTIIDKEDDETEIYSVDFEHLHAFFPADDYFGAIEFGLWLNQQGYTEIRKTIDFI